MTNRLTLQESIAFSLKSLLRKNNIIIDFKELEFQLLSYPFYPSLHTVTSELEHFGIENLTVEILPKHEPLNELHLVLVAKKEERFEIIFDKNNQKELSTEQSILSSRLWMCLSYCTLRLGGSLVNNEGSITSLVFH